MRVAVIGAGTMGGFHADVLGGMVEVTDLLIVDANPERASAVAERSGGRASSFEDSFEGTDAVIVATPPEFHRAAVESALDAGIHVLCEKPLADTLDATIDLTRRVEREGSHLEMGFQRRHDPGFVAARDAIEGRIHMVRLTAHDPVVPPPPTPAGGPEPEVAPAFRDSSIHDFDLVRWLTGEEVTEVVVEAGRRDGPRPDDPRRIESSVITMRLAHGALAVLDQSWLHPSGYDVRIEIFSEGSAVGAGLSPRTPTHHLELPDAADAMGPWTGYLDRFETAYRAELGAFLACCRGVRPPVSGARDGLEAMRIAVAATRSHVERRRVSLDEIPGLAWQDVA